MRSGGRVLAATVAAVSLLVVATGCGSDDEGNATTGATDTTETTGANERLTTEQWAAYTSAHEAFVAVNTPAFAKLDACGSKANNATQLQTCMGNAFADVSAATATYGDTLEGFKGTVGGACSTALDALLNYVRPYEATSNQMQTVIDDGNLAAYLSASSNLEVAAKGGQQATASFEASCKPV